MLVPFVAQIARSVYAFCNAHAYDWAILRLGRQIMVNEYFSAEMLTQPPLTGIDVQTNLAHFAIITFMVDPDALRSQVHPRFDLDCVRLEDGTERALVSVVPFVDQDFHFVKCPWPQWKFGQTNYRAYVRDRQSGEHVAWFFGTSLASWTVQIPRLCWKLPWYPARMTYNTVYDEAEQRYKQYHLQTKSRWAPLDLALTDSGKAPQSLIGFDNFEQGMALLTHPLKGYFYRRDGALGSYAIWHDRLQLSAATLDHAQIHLLARLGLVPLGDLSQLHSVMIQACTEFSIYLPPRKVNDLESLDSGSAS